MPSKRPLMRLYRDEEVFLRRWMYDEVHYGEGQGPAKRLQVQHMRLADARAALALVDDGSEWGSEAGPSLEWI